MSAIDVKALLEPLSEDAPCGDNLEYYPAFVAMDAAAQGKEEQQFGDTIVEAEGADWVEVSKNALSLATDTRDLRIALYLAQSQLRITGFVGFADSLELMHGYMEKFWEGVHPELDEDDDNDPTMRINTLVALCDSQTTLRAVSEAPLVSSRALGRFGLRDFAYARGELPVPESIENPPTEATIDGAFMDADIDELQATGEAIDRSIGLVESIDSTLMEKVGAGQAADFNPLVKLLKEAQALMAEQLARRGVGDGPGETEGGQAEAGGGGSGAVQRVSGDITSREDVIRMLDKICDYYKRHEPSSPLPILLDRAKRLVAKDFMEILKDMTPDGVSQAQLIGGLEDDD